MHATYEDTIEYVLRVTAISLGIELYLCSVVKDWRNKHTKTRDALFMDVGLEIFCSHLLTDKKEVLRGEHCTLLRRMVSCLSCAVNVPKFAIGQSAVYK